MRLLLSLFTGILLTLTARSQDFNYTVTADSVAWNELSSQTILNANNSAWSFSYRIPIGFSFNYLGRNFDSLTIETNGYLVFDGDRDYAFTAFNQFGDRVDGQGLHAVIGYEISGQAGNRVLKIQYMNTGQSMNDERMQSWQVWLKENGDVVEVRVGPGSCRYHQVIHIVRDSAQMVNEQERLYMMHFNRAYTRYELDASQYLQVALLSHGMPDGARGLFLTGNALNPSSQLLGENHPDGLFMLLPPQGYRYVFTPASN